MQRRRHAGIVAWLNATFRHWSLLPAVIVFVALTVYPMVNLLRMSVSTVEFRGGQDIWSFTPARNFAALMSDPGLAPTVRNTLIFVIAAVAAEMVIGLALALLVGSMTRGKGVMRTIMIVPILVPPVAIGSMFKLMYNHDFGLFNQMLAVVGLGPVSWLGSPSLALWSVVLVDVWHWVPFVFLILFAAVEGLPREVLEAGRVDGATRWQLFARVTLPLLMPAIVFAAVFRGIDAFRTFDLVYGLTNGGPVQATSTLSFEGFQNGFEFQRYGYASAVSYVMVITAAIGITLLLRVVRVRRADVAT